MAAEPRLGLPGVPAARRRGLIRGEARDGGNVFELTDAGRTHVEENREKLGNPWQQAGEGMPEGVRELIHLAMQVGVATGR